VVTQTWYLGLSREAVADRCILVGDPGRIDVFKEALDGAELVTERRGLRTVTGTYRGVPVTVAAFGIGATIAVIVMEELAQVGTRVFLRAGTAMRLGTQLPMGGFVVAHAAVREDGVSATYAPSGYPAVADLELTSAASAALSRLGVPHGAGLMVSGDGFYSDLFALTEARAQHVRNRVAELSKLKVSAADTETSALLTVGRVIGVRAGAICLLTVDAESRERIDPEAMMRGERVLVEASLDALTSLEDAGR
jgi:uridine phosphorylase